jgi:hypothetical protein
MAEQLSVRTSVVQSSQSVYQHQGSTSQSLRYTRIPLSDLSHVSSLIAEGSTHALVNLFLAQGIVLEGHSSLTTVDHGCEYIVQAELSGKHVAQDMYRLELVIPVGQSVQYVLCPC